MNTSKALLVAVLATATLPAFVGCSNMTSPTERRQSVGSYIDDATVTTRVKAALAEDKQVRVTQVNVETYQGVVQLSGFVDTESDVHRAAEVARNVAGVKSVKNDIRVKPR
ncbi:MAG TPA: BON domain-containing protein [Azonexus sp.]|nr:BON domain-containing protein [Azonexus sp.]